MPRFSALWMVLRASPKTDILVMIKMYLLESAWRGETARQKRKKKERKRQKESNETKKCRTQSEWTETQTSKGRKVEGPLVECVAMRWWLFVYRDIKRCGTVERQFIVVLQWLANGVLVRARGR